MHSSLLSSRPAPMMIIANMVNCYTTASTTGLNRCDMWICLTIHINLRLVLQCTLGKQWSPFLTWSCQHFKGLFNVMRLGILVWCSVTYSALICVYCSSYLSCVAAFSLPDFDIHCWSCTAPWAMWIHTANTTPLKCHNPFCFGGGSFHCACNWESRSALLLPCTHTRTHTCIHTEKYK